MHVAPGQALAQTWPCPLPLFARKGLLTWREIWCYELGAGCTMLKKYDIILSAEEEFARAVALGVLVKRPLTVWHYLIPGMFILDFLKRSSEMRKYSKHFLFPRKLAIDAAQDINNGEDKAKRLSRVKDEIKEWLNSLELYSQSLNQSQMEVVQLLIDHYSRLLNAEGDSFHSLIKNAWNSGENYEAYLWRLASAEKEVDRAIAEELGETEVLRERLLAEQQQVEKLRKKDVDIIFME